MGNWNKEGGRPGYFFPPAPPTVSVKFPATVGFLHRFSSLRTDPLWFQLLLGHPRTISLLCIMGRKGLLLLLIYGLLCKAGPGGLPEVSIALCMPQITKPALLSCTRCTDVGVVGILVNSCMESASASCFPMLRDVLF